MKNALIFIPKIVFILLLISYFTLFETTVFSNTVVACLTLFFSLLFLYKTRYNLPLFVSVFFIFYSNYSIIIGEYIIGGSVGAPMTDIKTIGNYGLNIRILLLFTSIVVLFYKTQKVKIDKFKIIPKDNIVIFYTLLIMIIYILIFGIKRSNLSSVSAYTISITPMYEYSTILFLFAYYFSGKSKLRRILFVGLIFLFVIQDFYYGGRITSIQLLILLLVTISARKLSVKFILICGSIGIFINSLVNAYRQSYSFNSIDSIGVFNNLKNNLFVFNTPVYAYYASVTHIVCTQIIDLKTRLTSFLAFIDSIFIGSSKSSNDLGNVTHITNTYFHNYGGGLITTYFYFWLGWAGVIVISAIIVFILNRLGLGKTDYWKLITVVIIYSVPRWYLYTPLSLFRPLFLVSVLFIILKVIDHILIKVLENNTKIDNKIMY